MTSSVHAPHELPYEVVRGADGKLWRRSVQAFIMNENGLFLAFTPVGKCNAGFRQTVQGGVDRGETPVQALTRELLEESGLALGEHVGLVTEVLPLNCAFGEEHAEQDSKGAEPRAAPTTGAANGRGEILDERRVQFRYVSKSWRKQGIAGQELYPFLLTAKSSIVRQVRLIPTDPTVRREFWRVEWLPLEVFVEQAPRAKLEVLQNILPAVYHCAAVEWHKRNRLQPLPSAMKIVESEYAQKQFAASLVVFDSETGLLHRTDSV